MCEHTRFWGPSLTSRDWEKFTYTAHFHMSQLCLAEATTCAVVQCWGFFPAQRQQGFDLPHGCFIATSMAVSLHFFFPFSPPCHPTGIVRLQQLPCLLLLPTVVDGAELNPLAPQIISIPALSKTNQNGLEIFAEKQSFRLHRKARRGGGRWKSFQETALDCGKGR